MKVNKTYARNVKSILFPREEKDEFKRKEQGKLNQYVYCRIMNKITVKNSSASKPPNSREIKYSDEAEEPDKGYTGTDDHSK